MFPVIQHATRHTAPETQARTGMRSHQGLRADHLAGSALRDPLVSRSARARVEERDDEEQRRVHHPSRGEGRSFVAEGTGHTTATAKGNSLGSWNGARAPSSVRPHPAQHALKHKAEGHEAIGHKAHERHTAHAVLEAKAAPDAHRAHGAPQGTEELAHSWHPAHADEGAPHADPTEETAQKEHHAREDHREHAHELQAVAHDTASSAGHHAHAAHDEGMHIAGVSGGHAVHHAAHGAAHFDASGTHGAEGDAGGD